MTPPDKLGTSIHELVNRGGLRPGETAQLEGGRTKYVEVGCMWRDRSDNMHYLSRTGEYKDRRYVPAHTVVIVELRS